MLEQFSRALAISALGASMVCASAPRPVPPPLTAEHLEIARLPGVTAHWAFVLDEAQQNETDARLHVFDADAMRYLGQIDAGYYPGVAIAPDGRSTAVATAYWSRGWHGIKTDVLEVTDNSTLGYLYEIVLPAARMQGPPTDFNVVYRKDAERLYVANLTPAASFTVVDLRKRAVLGRIDTAGCVLVIATGERSTSSICDNGRLLTVRIASDGREEARSLSDPFFNADLDPLMVQGASSGRHVWFVSFMGNVFDVAFDQELPRVDKPWPVVMPAERGIWRPGGTQPLTVSIAANKVYVAMHRGGEGSHKEGGSEIWVFDRTSHARIARWPIDTDKYGACLSLHVTSDSAPLLFAVTEKSTLLVLDAHTGKVRHAEESIGASSYYVMSP